MKDLHCHLPHGISDGPSEIAESMKMLRIASENGISYINAVAHFAPETRERLTSSVDALREEAEKLGITLQAGFEYTFMDVLESQEPFLTIGDKSNFILVDFSTKIIPSFAPLRFYELMSKGTRIILVHPEILFTRHSIPMLTKLADMKIVFMLNAASFLPETQFSIRMMAHRLLRSGIAKMVASDAHTAAGSRRIVLQEAREIISVRYGEENARILFDVNPTRVLENLLPYDLALPPEPFWSKWLPL